MGEERLVLSAVDQTPLVQFWTSMLLAAFGGAQFVGSREIAP